MKSERLKAGLEGPWPIVRQCGHDRNKIAGIHAEVTIFSNSEIRIALKLQFVSAQADSWPKAFAASISIGGIGVSTRKLFSRFSFRPWRLRVSAVQKTCRAKLRRRFSRETIPLFIEVNLLKRTHHCGDLNESQMSAKP